MKIATVSQASQMDRTAISDFSLPEILLMENAANSACSVIEKKTGIEGKTFLLICGPGNNGGDGLALARLIYSKEGAPLVLLNCPREKLSGSALKNLEILNNLPVEIIFSFTKEQLLRELEEADVVIDALFGTGLNRIVSGSTKVTIDKINKSGKPVISLDIPSGIHGDTGQVMGCAIRAMATVSFGALKPGNLLYPGYSHNGDLHLSRISFPPEIYNSEEFKLEVNFCAPLKKRMSTGHKKSFGNTLTIGGSSSYNGAPFFAASAVLKSGGGFSRLAAPESILPVLAGRIPEAVLLPQIETDEGSLALVNLERLLDEAAASDSVIIGPGLSLNRETAELIREFIKKTESFTIVDGDAISAIAGQDHLTRESRGSIVLTPHTGEMSRLCGKPVEEILRDPVNAARETSKKYGSALVLKGAHSLIAFPDERVFVNVSGNSGMGTAGSGDILTGVIAAMKGLGCQNDDAVRTAVFIHGASGDRCAEEVGKDGMIASDILENLPLTLKEFRENHDSFIKRYRSLITID